MNRIMLDLSLCNSVELTFDEMLSIEGGGFWGTLGIILGVAVAVASIYGVIAYIGVPGLLGLIL